jgi:quinol monooxygenase YgiN
MIVFNAILQARPGKEQKLEELLLGLFPEVKKEAGTVGYILHRDVQNPGRFFFYEKYVDQAAMELHMSTSYLQSVLKQFPDILEQQPITGAFIEINSIG